MAGFFTLLKSGFTTDGYYRSMNQALKRLNEDYTMLHYPFFKNDSDSFHTAQKNLTDYCMSRLPSMEGKQVLEIGCGNGVQAIYMLQNYAPAFMTAIDLNRANIEIARGEADKSSLKNIEFEVGDAQNLAEIKDHSIDFVINIESAFHYPDKPAFLREISRVLKPEGYFLIADILTVPVNGNAVRRLWKGKMHFNHWSKQSYDTEMVNSSLVVESFADITDQVIKGFERYRYWLKTMKKENFVQDIFLKLFYTINVKLNIRLLRTRRQYAVFTGRSLNGQTHFNF